MPNAIDVVDLVGWPSSVDIEPCQSMGQINNPINFDLAVTNKVGCASMFGFFDTLADRRPDKIARLWIIVHQRLKVGLGYLGLSHVTCRMAHLGRRSQLVHINIQ